MSIQLNVNLNESWITTYSALFMKAHRSTEKKPTFSSDSVPQKRELLLIHSIKLGAE